jgi:adenylate cyclase
MTELQLRLYSDTGLEQIIPVSQNSFTIGRSPDCNCPLSFPGISREHIRFFQTPEGQWLLEDTGSKNGTLLNGYLLNRSQVIKHGDLVHIGSIYLSVVCGSAEQPHQKDKNSLDEEVTIIRPVQDLQQQWIQVSHQKDNVSSQETAIARLKDLLEIAKGLTSAPSIEAIFWQAQAVVFRYITSIERLALLIDVNGERQLELLNAASKNTNSTQNLLEDSSWISHSICQRVFAEHVAIKTADIQKDERVDEETSLIRKGILTVMAVPLWNQNKVVGVLYADSPIRDSVAESEENLSFFSALANLVAASVQRWLLTRKLRQEETIRQRLERYLSPAVVQQIMTAGALNNGRIPPQESEISILFADIVGFTALSERLNPGELAALLNSFFEEMLQEIFAVGGTLDKFIGDCIMAFFGAPAPQEDHAERALEAARGMLNRLQRLNANNILPEPLQLRIAINSGKAVVGDVGSCQRVDYTVLGSTINLASRMEGICTPGQCVLSHATYQLLRPSKRLGLDYMGEYRFKGIDRGVKVYQLYQLGNF